VAVLPLLSLKPTRPAKNSSLDPQAHQFDPDSVITFSPFRLDLRSGRLLRGAAAIPLRPKTWAVLHYLAKRPGVLVSKDELLDAVWGSVAVTESTLSKSIGELRVALGDSFKAPRVIEMVQRRGFRFIATVTGNGGQVSSAAASSEPDTRYPTPDLFVGRDEELHRLAALFAKAQGGARQIVFVTGLAGIGKTALVEAFLDSPTIRDATAPVWVARGACLEQHGPREPYMPVIAALERLARRPDADRLVGLLRQVAPTWLAQIPG